MLKPTLSVDELRNAVASPLSKSRVGVSLPIRCAFWPAFMHGSELFKGCLRFCHFLFARVSCIMWVYYYGLPMAYREELEVIALTPVFWLVMSAIVLLVGSILTAGFRDDMTKGL
jgi:hypothetical protein